MSEKSATPQSQASPHSQWTTGMVAIVILLAIIIGAVGGVQAGSMAFPRTSTTTSYETTTTTSTFQTSYSYPVYVTVVTTTTETRFTYPYQQYPYPYPYPYPSPYPSPYPRPTGVLTVTYLGPTGLSPTIQARDVASGAVLASASMSQRWGGSRYYGQLTMETGRTYLIAVMYGGSTLYSTQIYFSGTTNLTMP